MFVQVPSQDRELHVRAAVRCYGGADNLAKHYCCRCFLPKNHPQVWYENTVSPLSSWELEENNVVSSPGLFLMQGFQGNEELALYFELLVSDRDLYRSGIGILNIVSCNS